MKQSIEYAIDSLNRGSLDSITFDFCNEINTMTTKLLKKKDIDQEDLSNMYGILLISNILYNNTTRSVLPLEDGVYDLLVSKYDDLTNGKSPVGAKPIIFDPVQETVVGGAPKRDDGLIKVIERIDTSNMLYFDEIRKNSVPIPGFYNRTPPVGKEQVQTDVPHTYPELAGTLDKCKFVLDVQAATAGVLDDPTVKIFERDFMASIFNRGMYFNTVIAELKYDGVAIETTVNGNTIISAISRGDTTNNEAKDLSHIFYGYKFPKATDPRLNGFTFGIQFECIVTYENMIILEQKFGLRYANGRVAAIGLLGRNDAREFVPYLTLVPLRSAGYQFENPQIEIEFLNKYYSSGVDLKYAVISGDYTQILYGVNKFVEDAQYLRPTMPFMYDGVVVNLVDPQLKVALGRINSVDKWAMAIKFSTEVKQTVFLGYEYTVGQNGVVTPMAIIRPVEFMGAVQNNISIHSFARFKQLGLRLGDIIRVEFRNDVMAYITKPDNAYNRSNPNSIIEFPNRCPFCGAPLVFSNKEALCPNRECPERNLNRVVNMFAKLNIKDFSKSSIKKLGITSLSDFINYPLKQAVSILGPANGAKFGDRQEQFLSTRYYDYRLVGAIGFSSIAQAKWKLILANIRLDTIIAKDDTELYNTLTAIKGIGPVAAKTIMIERPDLLGDLITITKLKNVTKTYGDTDERVKVRFTGVRDSKLAEAFEAKGCDADMNKGVTKRTNILIIPYIGYRSTKTSKISPGCLVLDVQSAWNYVNSISHFGSGDNHE